MNRQRQGGVALVMVLLILAVAVAVCMALVTQQHWQIQDQVAQRQYRQAWQLALEGEARALQRLTLDPRAAQAQPLRLQQGALQLQVHSEELSARLNLNALVSAPGQVDAQVLARLQRLLQLLDLPPDLVWTLVARLDPSALPAAAGRPPSPRGQGLLADISELRTLPGIDAQAYARLQPFVTALPAAIGINVNQAPALVLASLADGLGAVGGQQLLQARPAAGYRSVDAFRAQPRLSRHNVAAAGLQVGAQAYEIHSHVHAAEAVLQLSSIVVHDAGRWRVSSRQLRPLMAIEETQ
ncbi:MAG: type II secretion system minor pseudopilin GspK [Stenotrophomonas koreensis]